MTSVYGWNQGVGGTFWYRIAEPLRGLQGLGHETDCGPVLNDEILSQYETVLVHMLHDERGSEAWEKLARGGSHRLVFDIDDDVWNFGNHTDTRDHWTRERLLRLQNNIAMADVVTTPSDYLAGLLTQLNDNVHVLPNCVPEWLLTHTPVEYRTKFVIGYQGARQHTADLRTIADDIHQMLIRHRNARVQLWGELNPIGWPDGRVVRIPWNTDIPKYYCSLAMTIGIGPLADTPFNYAKSAIRAVEYAALGIPAMLSDFPQYRPYVHDGWTGWLMPLGESWLERLEWAYRNRAQVKLMGETARKMAENWTTERNAHRWQEAYHGRS